MAVTAETVPTEVLQLPMLVMVDEGVTACTAMEVLAALAETVSMADLALVEVVTAATAEVGEAVRTE